MRRQVAAADEEEVVVSASDGIMFKGLALGPQGSGTLTHLGSSDE